ncbi:hypothetical protein SUT328_16520 [Streptococcus parasuis]|nr:hypothetical protein SUT328_16520 [Streptococcus parasuis]
MKKKQFASKVTRLTMSMVLGASTIVPNMLPLYSQTVSANTQNTGILSAKDRGILYANSRTDFRDETIYFLITTRFYDGDSSNNARTSEDKKANNPETDPSWRGDFAGLIEQLDYIKALGFTAIWITPVVQNNSGYDYHGYHASNFNAVDYRYESNGVDYQTLIDAVHAKGMKIIQDVVFNHTSNFGEEGLNELGGESLKNQISSNDYPTRNKVVMNGTGDPLNIYHHNGFAGGGDWDNYEAQRKTIADDCFDLETENPLVYNYLIDAYKKYINMGVDGFRVDTVKHLSRLTLNTTFLPQLQGAAEANGNNNFYMFGEICTKGHDVWYRDAPPISTSFYTWDTDASYKARWSDTDLATNEKLVESHYLDHMNTGNQPTSSNAFLNGNDYHATDYSQKSDLGAIDFQMHWSFNNANQAFNTAKSQDRYFNDATWNVVYVDSHDYGPDNSQTVRYNGGTDAWAENLSLMFTFRGIPTLYYGSEVEFQAGKPIDVGPNAPLSATGRAYYGDYLEGTVDTTDFTEFGNLSGKVAETLQAPLSQHIIRLNRLRQAIPALRKGQYSTDGISGNMAFKRRYTDDKTDSFALVAISGNATFSGIPNGTYVDAVTGDTKVVSNGTLTAQVSGKGNMKVYVLNTSKTPAPGRVIPNGQYLTDGGVVAPIDNGQISVVEPTNLEVSTSSVTIKEATSTKVTAKVSPVGASPIVKWTSKNPEIATVSNGEITGVSVGKTTVTVKTTNGIEKTIQVTVEENPDIIKPTSITLNKKSLTLLTKESEQLQAKVEPENTTYPEVVWESSDPTVAKVDESGKVTALKPGTATITVTSRYGNHKAQCEVSVEKNTNATTIYFKNTANWATVNAYAWDSTSNPIQKNAAWPGESMVALGDGIYSIELSPETNYDKIIFNNGSQQTKDLTIDEAKTLYDFGSSSWSNYESADVKAVEGVTLNQASLELDIDQSKQLTATVTPSDATNKRLTWTSSQSDIATVSPDGLVKAIKAGKTEITVTTVDGSHVATCQVTVKEAPVKPVVLGVKDQSTDTIDISDTATLTLEVANAKTASYKLGNGSAVTFSNGQTITVGQNLAAGSSVTLTLTATSLDNQSVTKTYTITKKAVELPEEPKEEPITQTTIYFDNPDNWTDVYAYMYDAKGNHLLGAWPGTKMTKEASGAYALNVPSTYSTLGVKVLFSNNKGAQYPQSVGFDFVAKGTYSKTGLKVAEEVTVKEEVVTESIPFETKTVENPEVDKGVTNTLSEGKAGSKEITYKVTYKNGVEASREKVKEVVVTEPTPKVVEVGTKVSADEEKIATRVYFSNPQKWNKVYAYVYDQKGQPVVGTWPGKEMTKDEHGYYIELSADLVGGRIIFNNPETKVQYPAQNQAGFTIELGHLYDQTGNHYPVLPEDGYTRIQFENPGGWDAANVYAYYGNPIQSPLGAWPGKPMIKGNDGHFFIDLPEEYAEKNVKILFNKPNSNVQFPSAVGFDFKLDGQYTKDGLK